MTNCETDFVQKLNAGRRVLSKQLSPPSVQQTPEQQQNVTLPSSPLRTSFQNQYAVSGVNGVSKGEKLGQKLFKRSEGMGYEMLDERFDDKDRVVDSLLQDLDGFKPYEYKGKVNLPAMARFIQVLQNFECQAETIGLAGELNSRIKLSQIKLKLPEKHRMDYYKSVRDENVEDSISGLSKWLFRQQILMEKSKATIADSMEPKRVSKSLTAAVSWDSREAPSYARDIQKCALHPKNSSHYLKICNKFKALTLKEKYEVMKANGVCFRCGHNDCIAGKPPHDRNKCQFRAPCRFQTCGSDEHFPAICPKAHGDARDKDQRSGYANQADSVRPTQSNSAIQASAINHVGKLQATLPTVMGYLRCGSKRHLVRILLDGGSQATLVRTGIFPRMEGDLFQDHDLSLVGGSNIKRKLRVLDCEIEDLQRSWSYPLTATEIDKPCGNTPVIFPEHLQSYDHLTGVEIDVAPSPVIDLLLGVDNTHLMVWEQYIRGSRPDEPVVVKCPLGWFVQGGPAANAAPLLNYVSVAASGSLEEFIGLETAGLEPRKCKCFSDDEKETESMQKSVTQLPDGSYEVRLPWKRSPEELPDNYDYAVKRQKSLENQFRDRPNEWEVYCRQMRDQLERGVSRQVTQDELQQDRDVGRRMWFLPHFGVVKDSKTTPVRVVYDGKAKFQGRSLNDCLIKGENVNANLLEVALRFRENEVGMIADISKMFQAIKISPEDARFHRFVFRENPNHPIQVFELTTVTFGDKPSPTAAIITLRHVTREHAPDDDKIQKVIVEQFYMDDLNESVSNAEEALELKSKLTETLKKGNFNLRKWQSNVKKVCDETENTDTATVLGTSWDLSKDTLRVKKVKPFEDTTLTKRKILAQTASYYNVFGMLSGLLVRPKILLQRLWQLDLDWDFPLDQGSELYSMMSKINRDLNEMDGIEIPRCLIPEPYRGTRPLPMVSMHGVSDASEDAMGFAVWLRWSHADSQEAHLSFVCARSRVTPLKQTSMPRKELQALLLLSRLMITIIDALRFSIVGWKMWTDSMTAISWLRGQSKTFRSYVAHRVGEITSEFDPYRDIAYVPSDQNAVDLISRGGVVTDMQEVIKGPKYLRLPPHSWPRTPENVPVKPGDPERKKFHSRNTKTLSVTVNAVSKNSPIVDATKFSSWSKLQMVTARVLSLKELPRNQWLKQFLRQISEWPSQRMIKECVCKLDPFFDEDSEVYRVGGRLGRAPPSYDIRHPYLLPKKSHISFLLVCDRHLHALHGGHLRTANEVRKKYWIVGDMKIARRVVRCCITCRRHRGKPTHQRMADLPEFRVSPCSPPFKTTLVDYLGPVMVKLNRNTTTKGYGALFTCAVTWAVHLTVVQDLSTQAFLQALERFVSIRGAPAMMVSDNATCFRGADNTINELNLKLNQTQVREHCQRYKVEWKFGPPGGPHHQGAVERMVQEVKKAMRHLVKADRLTFVEWETVFCKISGLINSRPLTAMSSSPLDHPPLTPNHFLIGRGDLNCPDIPCEDYKGDLRKRRELCNTMVEGFWRRWMEYTHKLAPRQKWQRSSDNVEENDIVLVIGDDRKRGSWKMAEVVGTQPGQDGLVRVVEVKYADGTRATRPITKLVSLMKRDERSDI
ncbi:uncharacterized protein LOC100893156 [Strongylocentrotus purpuratus]|uniref:Integrase catalytic domain-containing protein n=1 Tax=Strongylocentrotus purpuratus TaxID=7668 RepID=A0A7M7HNL1_STRPU|nr:uncharacterized protein LOC100893156 [Strongylocentrotus purpuratus]